ncbi:MAG: hypothetical protein FJX76_00855 [Armatimonadetes bacterium]|nr:hypothetical protein [Armatimonadota bacterium]
MLIATALTAPIAPPQVATPYAPAAPDQSAPAQGDAVTVSGQAPPSPAPVALPEAEVEGKSGLGKKVAIGISLALAGATLAGVVAPAITAYVNPPQISTSVQSLGQGINISTQLQAQVEAGQAAVAQDGQEAPTQPTQQDPVQLVTLMAVLSEASSQQLLEVNAVQAQWGTDVAAMKATTHEVFTHVDSLIRNPGVNEAEHRQAIDAGIARLDQQLADFSTRLAAEGKTVDEFLGQNRDNLNQIGVLSYNFKANVDDAAGQYGWFTPQRKALNGLSTSFYEASKELAMSTERTTASRAEQQILGQNIQQIDQFLDQIRQINEASKKDPKAFAQVDQGIQVLEKVFDQTGQLVALQQKDVQEASARAHQGAEHLTQGLQQLINLTGGGQQQAPSEAPPG